MSGVEYPLSMSANAPKISHSLTITAVTMFSEKLVILSYIKQKWISSDMADRLNVS